MKQIAILLFIISSLQLSVAQKSVAIYWDASYSMEDRKIERELQFLDNYFKKYDEANVTLVMFSNDILSTDKFQIQNGNWTNLKNDLITTVHDGATSYMPLFKENADEYLLFTDGIENLNKLNAPINTPIHVITTVSNARTTHLKLISDLSKGRFIYLDTKALSAANIKEKTEELVSGIDDGVITGTIVGVDGNLANASVINQTSNIGTASDLKGNYSIKADEGDIIIFTYLGKKTVSIRVSKADIINISMANISESLGEVVISSETEEEEELVNVGNTVVDKRRLGYDVETITEEEISDQDLDLIGAVKGQFTNFEIPFDNYDQVDISQFLGRGKNMSIMLNQYGLVVVDGVPLGQTESEFGGIRYSQDNIINPEMIESITYLKGLAATNKYGTIGRNGVLLIVTKNAAVVKSTNKKEVPLGTTDTYSGDAQLIETLPNTPYILALKKSNSVNEAFGIYLKERELHGDDPVFYIDVADYFKGWKNPLISQRILSNVSEILFNDSEALKMVAYKQHAAGFFNDALITLEQISKLDPNHSQSYRDLALGYVYAKQYENAFNLYNAMDKNSGVNNISLLGIQKTVTNEFKNLIGLHGNSFNTAGTNDKYKRPIKYKSRIVFEWSNLNSEFDLNIINPQNRFFTWSHTLAENSQSILQEKQQGYGIEEFYLTEDDIGEWKFNMKYYGNGSDRPTFVKITTYKNYGSSNQIKTIEVVRLNEPNIEQTVTKVAIN